MPGNLKELSAKYQAMEPSEWELGVGVLNEE
jgi:hypothetical protein